MMERKTENKKKLAEVLVITLFLTYGIHYFGYFIRARYFNLLAPLAASDPGLHSVLRYLGHLVFWGIFAIYCFTVKGERKYFEAFLPGKGNNKISKLFLGMLIGLVMNVICVAGAALHGDITINGTESLNVGLFVLAFFAVLIQAANEELESRVFFFGKLKEGGFEFLPAVVLSGMYFSYLHATNPSFGIIPFINIALAGVVYLLIYVYTGSIWAACGLHQLWNVSQDFIFGLPNSGNPSGMSILSSTANGSSFFYNTDFGVEGSIWCILVHIAVTIILLILIKKKNIPLEKCSAAEE
ncbi:MAG: type II CAAX endopeptidase family protein [Eubacteriales bacterium]|nr:type II CAAX endopeptidase family protein [Eubacteriales bacterium]